MPKDAVRLKKKRGVRTELQNLCTLHTIKIRRNRTIIFSWLIVDDAMADDEEPLDYLLDDPELEQFLNEIVGERYVSSRTNWRYRSMSLTQRDVAVLATIQQSALQYFYLLVGIAMICYQLMTVLQFFRRQNRSNARLNRVFYTITLCWDNAIYNLMHCQSKNSSCSIFVVMNCPK
jgi:hypothetical protein